jgi:hypothetical protein
MCDVAPRRARMQLKNVGTPDEPENMLLLGLHVTHAYMLLKPVNDGTHGLGPF